jgi:hypothetical protein
MPISAALGRVIFSSAKAAARTMPTPRKIKTPTNSRMISNERLNIRAQLRQ